MQLLFYAEVGMTMVDLVPSCWPQRSKECNRCNGQPLSRLPQLFEQFLMARFGILLCGSDNLRSWYNSFFASLSVHADLDLLPSFDCSFSSSLDILRPAKDCISTLRARL